MWQAYEDRVNALMADTNTRLVAPPENQTALQKVDQTVDIARDRLTAMEDIAVAVKALYAMLSNEQNTIADQRLIGTLPQFYSEGGPIRGGCREDSTRGRPRRHNRKSSKKALTG